MSETFPCPGCGRTQNLSPRYPVYYCPDCVAEAVDVDGNKVEMFNVSIGGGFAAVVVGTKTESPASTSHAVFIRGEECWADEAYFGGIVVRPGGAIGA